MSRVLDELATKAGLDGWFDYQHLALTKAMLMSGPQQRRCLYYKTGAGKSVTALAQMYLWEQDEVLVVTPPSTFDGWTDLGEKFGINVECMSHAKFRMAGTKLRRDQAIIADELHLFGGHAGKGWIKLDRIARHLQAPMVLASATPNYNDAERVYCVQHILDPQGTKDGFLNFLYAHCTTEQNPFGMYPIVTGFHQFKDAEEFLASLPGVDYIPDDLIYTIKDYKFPRVNPTMMALYGLNERRGRMIASSMEEKHAIIDHSMITDSGKLRIDLYDFVMSERRLAGGPLLVFANHSTVAQALATRLHSASAAVSWALVTGDTTTKNKNVLLEAFRQGDYQILIGTASLATGTDGLDKVCNSLLILDDTEDDSLRRQLIGRIMPRGLSTNFSSKSVSRVVLT